MMLALASLAIALDSGDEVQFELRGGGEVQGYALQAESDHLVVSNSDAVYQVHTALVTRVWVAGVELDVDTYHRDLDTFRRAQLEARGLGPDARRPPPPWVVGGASLLWPGSGHLLLGDLPQFIGYSCVEIAFLGIAAYWVFGAQLYGPLIPLALLDGTFRAYAAADTVRSAKRRRAQLVLAPGSDGGAVVGLAFGSTLTPAHLTAWGRIH